LDLNISHTVVTNCQRLNSFVALDVIELMMSEINTAHR